MAEKTGDAIRAARTAAKLTQAALAQAVGLTAADIRKAERGEAELSQAVLKKIAKATGVTQASLLHPEAAKKKDPAPIKLTQAERTLLKRFRAATPDQRNDALRILNGEPTEVEQLVDALLGKNWKKKVKK